MGLLDALNPLEAIAKIGNMVKETVDEFHTSSEEKGILSNALAEIQMQFVTTITGLQIEVLKLEKAVIEAHAQIVTAEATSESAVTRMWRPISMLAMVATALLPYWAGVFGVQGIPEPAPWIHDLLKIGIGGYIGGRTVEKVVPNIVKMIRETRTIPSIK